jgi:hypothetical protein
MTRLAQLAAVVVDRKPRRPLARYQGGLLVGRARTDRNQRAGNAPSDELVLTRRLRTLVALDLALTALTAHAPRLLTRKKLGEHVRLTVASGEALVALAPMPRPPVRPVQMHPRARVLRPRARRPRRARAWHPARPPSRPGAYAPDRPLPQREARGGTGLLAAAAGSETTAPPAASASSATAIRPRVLHAKVTVAFLAARLQQKRLSPATVRSPESRVGHSTLSKRQQKMGAGGFEPP